MSLMLSLVFLFWKCRYRCVTYDIASLYVRKIAVYGVRYHVFLKIVVFSKFARSRIVFPKRVTYLQKVPTFHLCTVGLIATNVRFHCKNFLFDNTVFGICYCYSYYQNWCSTKIAHLFNSHTSSFKKTVLQGTQHADVWIRSINCQARNNWEIYSWDTVRYVEENKWYII